MADKAVQGLVDAGVEQDAIFVLCSNEAYRKHFPDLDTLEPSELSSR